MKYKFITVAVLLLSSCSFFSNDKKVVAGLTIEPFDEVNYSSENFFINLPSEISTKIDHSDGNLTFSSRDDFSLAHKPTDFFVRINDQKQYNCDYYEALNPIVVEDKENDLLIVRGRTDGDNAGYTTLGCGISSPAGAFVPEPVEGAYLFCSVYNEQEVSICLHQETDNYTFANDILDTFRWDGVSEEAMQSLIQESRQKLDEYESTHERRVYKGSAPHG